MQEQRAPPYYSRALFAYPIIFTDKVETMAIDTRWRIYIIRRLRRIPEHPRGRLTAQTRIKLLI